MYKGIQAAGPVGEVNRDRQRANGPSDYVIRVPSGGCTATRIYLWTNVPEADNVLMMLKPRRDCTAPGVKKGSDGIMSNGPLVSLKELDKRIAITRDNIRQLIEQAAAYSGAEDEERSADRLAQQNEELERLLKQRETLLKK